MDYRSLGRTGVKVSPLCLGAMMFGAWGNPDHDDSVAIIHAALDAGINFIDTADVYSAGESEEIVGKALAGRRDDVVLATKVHAPMGDGPQPARATRAAGSCRSARTACAGSAPTTSTSTRSTGPTRRCDIDETLGALTDLVHQGKVRYLGSSTFPASEIVEAQWMAERRGRERFVCEQPPYSILVRGIEADVLPTCQRYGMGVIPWSPLAGGWLSGKWRKGADGPRPAAGPAASPTATTSRMPENQRKLDAADALGRRWPTRPASASCTWRWPACSTTRRSPPPIIGPRTMEQLDQPARRRRRVARPPTCSTASTRSSRPAPTSAGPTPATCRRAWPTSTNAAAGPRRRGSESSPSLPRDAGADRDGP